MSICIICRKNKAEVPDRERMGSRLRTRRACAEGASLTSDERLLQAAKDFCSAHRAAMAIRAMWERCSESYRGTPDIGYDDSSPRCDLDSPDDELCPECLQRKKTRIGYRAMLKDRATAKARMLRAERALKEGE